MMKPQAFQSLLSFAILVAITLSVLDVVTSSHSELVRPKWFWPLPEFSRRPVPDENKMVYNGRRVQLVLFENLNDLDSLILSTKQHKIKYSMKEKERTKLEEVNARKVEKVSNR